jgi:hypothetical protein
MLKNVFSVVTLLFAIAPSASAACAWNESYISADVKPKSAKSFQGITKNMPLTMIIRKLGPAKQDVGSGLHVLQWEVSDGRVFNVSVADACTKPFALGFSRRTTHQKAEKHID